MQAMASIIIRILIRMRNTKIVILESKFDFETSVLKVYKGNR